MSQKYPGGFITKTPTAPTSSAAPGIWTLDQAMQNQKAGNWPSPPSPYIEDWFSTYLYTGNSSTQTITNGINLSANGGMVWGKSRTAASSHNLYDTVRGASNRLAPNLTNAQANTSPSFSSFNSNGFSLNGASDLNNSGDSIVSWTFAERQKFFDVVTYTGDGSSLRSLSHSLGSEPGFIVVKKTSGAENWGVYHRSLPAAGRIVYLNLTFTDSDGYVGFTPPTSSIFYVGGGGSGISGGTATSNENGATYVAYLFAHNAGGFGLTGSDNVISCGSYTGTGATGNAITLGYAAQWVMVKRTDTGSEDWKIMDAMRSGFLEPNTSDVESGGGWFDVSGDNFFPTATGFQINTGGAAWNASGGTYIYIAIRRGPMKVPTLGTTVLNAITRSGNSTATTVTGVGFAPDLVFEAARTNSGGNNWVWFDRLRGGAQGLSSDNTGAEFTNSAVIQSDSLSTTMDGFRIQTANPINASGNTYVYYPLKRAPGFFDVVCYTGTGSATTQTHNLGVAPEMMIVKSRSNGALGWYVYSTGLGPTKCNQLNQTDGQFTSSTFWNDTAPTSSVFTLGSGGTNGSGNTQVAYLFATCPGVSKVGSYTGNGASQTINCGFTTGSRFVLIKRTDTTSGWYVWDSARGIVAGNDPYLLLNSTAAEVTGTDAVDTDSTGFIVNRLVAVDVNENAGTYIFLAIA